MNFKEGVILGINKPYRMSSFGALAHIRYVLSKHLGYKVKIGHAGTLDPLATGVLILCTGRATKQIEELQKHTKEYTATLQLGATTPSYDMEHPVDQEYPTAHITEGTGRRGFEAIRGRYRSGAAVLQCLYGEGRPRLRLDAQRAGSGVATQAGSYRRD